MAKQHGFLRAIRRVKAKLKVYIASFDIGKGRREGRGGEGRSGEVCARRTEDERIIRERMLKQNLTPRSGATAPPPDRDLSGYFRLTNETVTC